MIEFPTTLTDLGFEKDAMGDAEFIYHDDAKATGSVIVVTVSKTPPKEIEVTCRELRRLSMKGYAEKATEPQLNEVKNACHFFKTSEMTKIPISGKTIVRTDDYYPEYMIIVSGLWAEEHHEKMLKIFDEFTAGISVRPKNVPEQ